MNRRSLLAVASALALLPALASAQAPATPAPNDRPVRLRGVIDSVSADSMAMTTRTGEKVTVGLPANLRVNQMLAAKLSDITADSYIGSAAVAQPDGTLRALQVTIFPPAARGTAAGHFPWDLGPESTMTNGTVATMTNGTVGNVGKGEDVVLTVKYPDGEKRILVPEDAPVVTFVPGDRALLVAGGQVVVNGRRAEAGTITAASVLIGKDGLVPPN
ncbi:hypothetical protein [Roseomonas haemaphysalidis]|uniref:DUF5666 domain-containing protein n=1 Tax=Roseomonas haemaphysalidis TaxID=2768162 RepID=A0ABS3KNB1_9PROT|nr:hypothetical protein [Roseomonas haemaphysalidis]MBO1078941.1 hypothetical protein [Roseomonas haemaphysalidis]